MSDVDYSLEEVKKLKWTKHPEIARWTLGDFCGDTHIAYNEVTVQQYKKTRNYVTFTSYNITIAADFFGEKGFRKNIVASEQKTLREVKAMAMQIIENAYVEQKWCFKKRNLES